MAYIRITVLATTQELINNRMNILIDRAEERGISYFGPYNYHQESREGRTYWRQAIGFRDRESAIRDVLDTPVPDYLHRYIEEPRTSEETDIVDMESKSPAFPLPEKNEGDANKKGQNNSGEITTLAGNVTGLDGIEKLRKQAKNSGNASISTTCNTNPTQEYSRSSKVREYVKARANGTCEGCGNPAPFTSKTGEPYLHAHHIYELSEGGEDTIETVVALCPNCHYRVHHGENGEEYNQELLETVQNIESFGEG
ncbi:HNH endonuclease [Haloarcula quadrata]|uniref:HNH endonuclease n=1 Tax=Haloarcula quadrata TaxID=182779 RepID=A0A495R2E6_9EURY|nr:HNH endonuclease signature motif containing protein [Haloarcula quadrata]RKS81457.1 HNH endonuclease [Haloarcula quadrata]